MKYSMHVNVVFKHAIKHMNILNNMREMRYKLILQLSDGILFQLRWILCSFCLIV